MLITTFVAQPSASLAAPLQHALQGEWLGRLAQARGGGHPHHTLCTQQAACRWHRLRGRLRQVPTRLVCVSITSLTAGSLGLPTEAAKKLPKLNPQQVRGGGGALPCTRRPPASTCGASPDAAT